jgi:hypothetical protein
MAYVKTRATSSGAISTALVEAYRDANGRPRQRILANLHGEPDVVSALARLAARRDALRKEQEKLTADRIDADRFYEVVTTKTLAGHQYSATERKEIDRLMRLRDRLLQRLPQIEAELATIQQEGVIIKQHCTASPDKVQAAIRAYQKKAHDAEALMLGTEFSMKQHMRHAKAELRRYRT